MPFHRLACVALALVALCAMSVGSLATAVAAGPEAAAAKKKKKCKAGKKKKKVKKGTASAKKKCGKKKGKKKGTGKGTPQTPTTPAPPAPPKASGPEIPAGTYPCSSTSLGYAGTVHILAGNRYMVNEGPAVGNYVFYPDTGVMQFPSGDYDWAYGVYVADSKGFDIYSNYSDGILEVGDYGWTCYLQAN